MSGQELSDSIKAATTALQILDLRVSGHGGMVPPEFDAFTDRQIAAMTAQRVVEILAAVTNREEHP